MAKQDNFAEVGNGKYCPVDRTGTISSNPLTMSHYKFEFALVQFDEPFNYEKTLLVGNHKKNQVEKEICETKDNEKIRCYQFRTKAIKKVYSSYGEQDRSMDFVFRISEDGSILEIDHPSLDPYNPDGPLLSTTVVYEPTSEYTCAPDGGSVAQYNTSMKSATNSDEQKYLYENLNSFTELLPAYYESINSGFKAQIYTREENSQASREQIENERLFSIKIEDKKNEDSQPAAYATYNFIATRLTSLTDLFNIFHVKYNWLPHDASWIMSKGDLLGLNYVEGGKDNLFNDANRYGFTDPEITERLGTLRHFSYHDRLIDIFNFGNGRTVPLKKDLKNYGLDPKSEELAITQTFSDSIGCSLFGFNQSEFPFSCSLYRVDGKDDSLPIESQYELFAVLTKNSEIKAIKPFRVSLLGEDFFLPFISAPILSEKRASEYNDSTQNKLRNREIKLNEYVVVSVKNSDSAIAVKDFLNQNFTKPDSAFIEKATVGGTRYHRVVVKTRHTRATIKSILLGYPHDPNLADKFSPGSN